jgi:hypothetical protein
LSRNINTKKKKKKKKKTPIEPEERNGHEKVAFTLAKLMNNETWGERTTCEVKANPKRKESVDLDEFCSHRIITTDVKTERMPMMIMHDDDRGDDNESVQDGRGSDDGTYVWYWPGRRSMTSERSEEGDGQARQKSRSEEW